MSPAVDIHHHGQAASTAIETAEDMSTYIFVSELGDAPEALEWHASRRERDKSPVMHRIRSAGS